MAWVYSYELKCDGPGKGGGGCTKFSDPQLDEDGCAEWAEECGWLITAHKHYCPECRRLHEAEEAK